MNKRLETQIKYINDELSKIDQHKADIFRAYLTFQKSQIEDVTYIKHGPVHRKMIAEIDPTNYDKEYIVNNILKYQKCAWHFYKYLYHEKILGREFRFLDYLSYYKLLNDLSNQGKTVDYIVCCDTGTSTNRYILPINDRRIIEMIESFCDNKNYPNINKSFVYYISSFLYNNNILSFEGFNDELIKSCILNAPSVKVAHMCRKFILYCLLASKDGDKNLLYDISVLCRNSTVNDIMNGFVPILYNVFEPVPLEDKWLIKPNGEENRSTCITSESVIYFDFSTIKNSEMKKHLKKWIWVNPISITSKAKELIRIIYFLNMFFEKDNPVLKIDQNICALYKSHILSKWNKTGTRNQKIYSVLKFIRFIDDNTDIEVDKSCYLYLNNKGSLKTKGAIGVKKEELEVIAAYINDHKNDDHNHLCFYVMFHIALNTEFRISQIVSLSNDCIKGSMKTGEYVIQSNMKQSGYETIDQPCARVVKEIISSYQIATNEYREKLNPSLRQYLFVREYGSTKINRPFTSSIFSKFLKKTCEKLGLPGYTAKNLRITYITNAKEYAMKNGISDLTLLKITNHANINTVNNHYIQEKIVDALQATIGVVIGDVNIDGTISSNTEGYDTSNESAVANGCGFCQSAECTSQGPSPCQRCKHFFTTISNIPYYKKEIERLKALNDGTKSPHDAEDIINLIRLNTYILGKLIELKGDMNNGTIC